MYPSHYSTFLAAPIKRFSVTAFCPSHVRTRRDGSRIHAPPLDSSNNMAAVTAVSASRTRSARQANACQVQVTLITGIIYTAETQGGKVALYWAVEARFRPSGTLHAFLLFFSLFLFPSLTLLCFSVLKRTC